MYPVKPMCDLKPCGLFGAVRRYDVHTGLDLYCEEGEPVLCISAGVVVDVFQFTGESAGTGWWNDTQAVVVSSGDKTYVYGELESCVEVGSVVSVGDKLGAVVPVLKTYKGTTPTAMLHLEVWMTVSYKKNYVWPLGHARCEGLLDPIDWI